MNYGELLNKIVKKQIENVKEIGARFPYCDSDGKFDIAEKTFWTNGYWPGLLWLCFKVSGEEIFKNTAIELEESLDELIMKNTLPGHDVGFVWLLSSGIHNAIYKNEHSERRLMQMTNFLAGRFNIKSKTIRAWDSWGKSDKFPTFVIIDCMMNIPLLFLVSNMIGDPRYKHIAKAHADTVLKHFIDDDGAVRHICRFDLESGEYIEPFGGQGYSESSAWSRGASWAIYGFAMACRYTGDKKYIDASKKVADFFLSEIEDDYVPAWDFRAPDREVKDSSAGAIAASGMLEIFANTGDTFYKEEAEKIIKALYESCYVGDKRQVMIDRSTANRPSGKQVDTGIIYADYYFTEAVYKLAKEDYSLPWEA